ncbi:MAG TPA: hypothetical protein VMT54_12605 [Candidatus Cybelea sp.]|nr:hypothetical protein [Candidatus Cybelea sp.]
MRSICVAAFSALVLAACASPSISMKSGEFTDEQARSYLIYADQLQRVRNVWKKPMPVCLAMEDTDPLHRALGGPNLVMPTWPEVLERLRHENDNAAVKLAIDSSEQCLGEFVRTGNGPAPVQPQDAALILAEARDGEPPKGVCGHKYVGGYHTTSRDSFVSYDVETEAGVMKLTGGEACMIGWFKEQS